MIIDLFKGTELRRRPDGQCELIGTVAQVIWVADDKTTVIARLLDNQIVKGEQDALGINPGLAYRFLGRYETHHKHGEQFRFDTYVRDCPHEPKGVAKYLAEICPGIGPAKANVLVHHLGTDAAAILRENPMAAVDFGVLTKEQAHKAAEALKKTAATEATRIDLFTLTKGRGFSQKFTEAAIERWGAAAADTIRRNPYLPMKKPALPSAGFKRCDKLYLDLGRDPKRLKRQALCILYALETDTTGHTWLSADALERVVVDAVGRREAKALEALQLLKRARKISVRRDGSTSQPQVWVAEAENARNEWLISEHWRRLSRGRPRWPILAAVESISEHQAGAIGVHLATAPVWLLLGTPGTGKTFTAAAIVKACMETLGREHIAVCAPTGKAAVRITAALDNYGLKIEAATIHRTLGVQRNGHDGHGWDFKFGPHEPLPYRVLVIDEVSMCDTEIFAKVLQACANGTNLLLVGDVNQLPPVGHGSPLRDLIAAGAPRAELTEIRRNAGMIVEACRDIKEGRAAKFADVFDEEAGKNLRLIETNTAAESLETVCSILQQFRARGTFDPIWECQALCAVNESSELSRHRLNVVLQAILNPSGQTAVNNPFRRGDKIICLRNGTVPAVVPRFNVEPGKPPIDPESYVEPGGIDPHFVANGDIGRVLAVGPGVTIARLLHPERDVKIVHHKPKDDAAAGEVGSSTENAGDADTSASEFNLAYAVTTHKMQGSEAQVVFVLIDDYGGARRVCDRSWWYTAISRAKRLCVLIGEQRVMEKHCRRVSIEKRKTFLAELLKEATEHG